MQKKTALRAVGPVVLLFFAILTKAQPTELPRNYFRHPLDFRMEIVSNFGELRPDHWHMGLDIRTRQRENQLVRAAADGYVAYAGIRPFSFGRFLIIRHPNGLSTLYGHLNDFNPELEAYVTAHQYEQESWATELTLPANRFPVKKGDFIAFSGTTGGSQGPHVHFEIFDTESGKRLNPLLFNFPLPDQVPPDVRKLAIYDRSRSVYGQTPTFYTVHKTDTGYIVPKQPVLITAFRQLSFGIQATDRLSGSNNPNGIYSAQLFLDGVPQVFFKLDSISYNETIYENAQIDYPLRHHGGVYIQHIAKLPGDRGGVYHLQAGDGTISLSDTLVHQVRIDVRDASNNSSVIIFSVQLNDSLANQQEYPAHDLVFRPNRLNLVTRPDFEMNIPEEGLYDTVYGSYSRTRSAAAFAASDIHEVNDASIPIQGQLIVRIKPDRSIPAEWEDHLVIKKGGSVRAAEKQGDWYAAKFGDFGSYQLLADMEPPTINELGRGDTIDLSAQKRILFTPEDNFDVASFRAELDGKWIRFTNDKGRNWIYIFDERCPYGVHKLSVTVTDLVGNTTTKTWWFRRHPYTPPPRKKAVYRRSSKKPAVKKKTSHK